MDETNQVLCPPFVLRALKHGGGPDRDLLQRGAQRPDDLNAGNRHELSDLRNGELGTPSATISPMTRFPSGMTSLPFICSLMPSPLQHRRTVDPAHPRPAEGTALRCEEPTFERIRRAGVAFACALVRRDADGGARKVGTAASNSLAPFDATSISASQRLLQVKVSHAEGSIAAAAPSTTVSCPPEHDTSVSLEARLRAILRGDGTARRVVH